MEPDMPDLAIKDQKKLQKANTNTECRITLYIYMYV